MFPVQLWDFCPAGTKEDFPALGSFALLKIEFLGDLPMYGAPGRWGSCADVLSLGDISGSRVLCNHFLALLMMRGWWGSKISPSQRPTRSAPTMGCMCLWESPYLGSLLCTRRFSIIQPLFKQSSSAQERSSRMVSKEKDGSEVVAWVRDTGGRDRGALESPWNPPAEHLRREDKSEK